MNNKLNSAFASHLLLTGMAVAVLIGSASPASAYRPLTQVVLDERIRQVCEASSADAEGRGNERRCRAEWHERVRKLEALHGPGRVKIDLK